ncbi:reverse transcriptase [Tanacetum coccineum]|uniref:Reverse transcriptase n=1 Tax=Tanacetum coccineum TaxID=301880 RepID=A0ABQ5AP72_9ASTR
MWGSKKPEKETRKRNQPSFQPQPEVAKDSARVTNLINNGVWDVSKLNEVVLPKAVSIISQIPISKTGTSDKLVWHYEVKGRYTVKSGYHQVLLQHENCSNMMASSSSAPNKSFWKELWNLKTLPRVKAALGVIACDSTGSIHLCSGEKWCASDPLMAEILAIKSACHLAISQGWQNATIESDSKLAVSFASSKADPPWVVAAIVDDIKLWESQLALSFSWVNRACNLAAHHVAKIAFNSHVNFVCDVTFPVEITSIRAICGAAKEEKDDDDKLQFFKNIYF